MNIYISFTGCVHVNKSVFSPYFEILYVRVLFFLHILINCMCFNDAFDFQYYIINIVCYLIMTKPSKVDPR